MSVTTHVYTAVLAGNPDVAVAVKGGSITLDERNAPHVQGWVDVAIPPLATLTGLDPRQSRRIKVKDGST